jgi:hypothetical protein
MHTLYKSRNFYLSAFLLAEGCKLDNFARLDGITTFEFEMNDTLLERVRQYFANQATVNPIAFGNALKNLKSLIHTNRETYEYESTHNYGAQQ